MRLHANAALSWNGRRRLVERVVGEGWTVTAAAEAAGVSVRCTRKWVGRFRTLLAGWAYGAIYGSSRERTAALDGWLWHYNHRRRHSALGHQPPVTRTNLLGSYI
jgi:transposase InsO family protein